MTLLKKSIVRFFEFINYNNINSKLSVEEIRRINLTNYIALIIIANIIGYSIFCTIAGFKQFLPALIFHFVSLVITSFIIVINIKGHHKAAKIFLCTYTPIMMAGVATFIFGKDPGFQLFILVSLLIPAFIWSYNEKKYLFGFLVLNLFLYIGIEFFPPIVNNLVNIPKNYIQQFSNSNLLINFIGAAIAIIGFQVLYNSSERKLVKQAKELRISQKERSKIYSIIAHDLKGPIGTIKGLSELLIKDLDKENDKRFDDITKALFNTSNSTQALLENLLDWSKMNQLDIPLKQEKISVRECFYKTIKILNYQIKEKKHKVEVHINDDLNIICDSNSLCVIFRNLIANAIKFTPTSGTISISGKHEKGIIKFSIADSGIGMPDHIKNNLFNPSKNVVQAGTNNETGTGLGLLICKDYVDKNGGHIWVESKPNQGSTFYFTLNGINNI
ncbi:MAG: HAMP domain-containing histidine kinase [Salinivirgaceae bacterium]|nr:HAMP domain-containing histidine kinase [Salinivirgaceae bacterium]